MHLLSFFFFLTVDMWIMCVESVLCYKIDDGWILNLSAWEYWK
jgi:hypothetical protein